MAGATRPGTFQTRRTNEAREKKGAIAQTAQEDTETLALLLMRAFEVVSQANAPCEPRTGTKSVDSSWKEKANTKSIHDMENHESHGSHRRETLHGGASTASRKGICVC